MGRGSSEEDALMPAPLSLKDGSQILAAYKGKVVAIFEGEVRASADTWADCVRSVQRLGLDLAATTFTSVPRHTFAG